TSGRYLRPKAGRRTGLRGRRSSVVVHFIGWHSFTDQEGQKARPRPPLGTGPPGGPRSTDRKWVSEKVRPSKRLRGDSGRRLDRANAHGYRYEASAVPGSLRGDGKLKRARSPVVAVAFTHPREGAVLFAPRT